MSLSLALDLAMARELEHAMRSAVLAARFAKKLGESEAVAREAYFYVLLRFLGCTSDQSDLARVAGHDEHALMAVLNRSDWTSALDSGRAMLGVITRGKSLGQSVSATVNVMSNASLIASSHATHCEVATELARRLGLDAGIQEAIGQSGEAWNGRGGPSHLAREAIRPSVRLASMVEDHDTFRPDMGDDRALELLRARRGKMYDPRIVDAWVDHAREAYASIEGESLWDLALREEPGEHTALDEAGIDAALEVVADYADLKSAYARGHSREVARLAEVAAGELGLGAEERITARRAGLVHDVGCVAVPAFVWDEPGPLGAAKRERMQTHAYYTDRVLQRPALLGALGSVAVLAHERLDGGGYPRRARGSQVPAVARVLAAADVWQALVSERAWRKALTVAEARAVMEAEAEQGRLDADAVRVVLKAAGLRPAARARGAATKELSEREVEVLRVLALGKTNKEIASALGISVKTVDNHLQSIFGKLGVTTRGGATLAAMRAGLCG